MLTSCLTTIKSHIQSYCSKTYENSGINLFWSIKNSGEFLNKLTNKHFRINSISTYDFSTLYTTLPHNLIKDKLNNLICKVFAREKHTFLACNYNKAFFTDNAYKGFHLWTYEDVCKALLFLLDNIYVRYGHKVCRQAIGIPMGTNCAPLIADLFLYCYERDFMLKLSKDKQSHIIEAFNDTSRYLDDICNIDNKYFSIIFQYIYPKELVLNKANLNDLDASFLDLHLTITDGTVTSKIYDKRDDFNFDIVNYPQLDGDIPRATSYGVYISQLIRFARACSKVEDFHARNFPMTTKLLQQGYRYHKLRKTFRKFYNRSQVLLSKYNTNLKSFMILGIAHPEFYGDVVYKLRKIECHSNFKICFSKTICKFRNKGYKTNILEYSAKLALQSNKLNNHHHLFVDTMTFQD